MDNGFFTTYKIGDRSHLPFLKREIHNLATAAGFSSLKVGEIDIIVSELTSNLIKFAGSGDLLYRLGKDSGGDFFEAFCHDAGQGIANLPRMLVDGMSSSKTLGQGLGAISRLSSSHSIYTLPQWGTILHVKAYREAVAAHRPALPGVALGAVQACYPGEKVCGDGYYAKPAGRGILFFMGDGLGHGQYAHEAVQEAIAIFKKFAGASPAALLQAVHEGCKKTRGLVASVAYLDLEQRQWYICGVGNIATNLYSGLAGRTYTPHNGIVGHNIPRTLTDSVFPAETHQVMVMHSDGLKTRWKLGDYAGLLRYPPEIISGVLFKDQARHTDDMTVMTIKLTL